MTTHFSPGSPVKDKFFYGRHGELKTVFKQRWTWVCGQRRLGKTSLLQRVETEARTRNWLPLFCGLDGLSETANGLDLFRYVFEKQDRSHFARLNIGLSDFAGISPADCFRQLVAKLGEGGQSILFLWDEAEHLLDVARQDPAFFLAVQELSANEHFRWVLAASQSLSGMFGAEEGGNTFLKAFRWLPLAMLEKRDAAALLRCEQTGGWISLPADRIISQAIEWTGGHPLVLQELGQALEQTVDSNGRRISDEVFRRCRAALVQNGSLKDIFQDDYGRLTPVQQAVLQVLCQAGEPISGWELAAELQKSEAEVTEALSFLLHYGYVSWGDQVRLRYGFYRDFLAGGLPATRSSDAGKVQKIARTMYLSDHEAELVKRFQSPGAKRILALDGGGIRGALTLGFLERMEGILRTRHNDPTLRLCDYFDLIGGTSTGAIIATALALGMEAAAVKQLYLELGGKVFGQRRSWWQRLVATFREAPLREALKQYFDDVVFGDEAIKTGLCIFIKRADINQTFPYYNHPHARFYARRRGILLRDAVRASTAAPTYFVPELLEIGRGEIGAFIDGGLSMVNNPALYLLLMATLKRFPFRWPVGAKNLLLVSLGTGAWYQRAEVQRVAQSKLWDWGRQIPAILMDDASLQNQLILQWLSQSPTAIEIDDEFGELEEDLLHSPVLHYLRYNVLLDRPSLADLGLASLSDRAQALREMSAGENRDWLLTIGETAAKKYIREEHFPAEFDLQREQPM